MREPKIVLLQYSSSTCSGLKSPNMPEPIRAKLEAAFRKSLTDPAFVGVMDRVSMEIIDMSGADTKALVQREFQRAQQLEREGVLGSPQR